MDVPRAGRYSLGTQAGLFAPPGSDIQFLLDDADGDGFGDPATEMILCEEPVGYITDGSDCDDTDSAAYPSAEEVCDDVDNDCDGELDCNDTDDTVNPDGTEVCKGHYDEDCDGLFEHEDPDIYEAADPTIYGAEFYYIDADGDGYGDEDTDPEVLCPS